jgi:hypothetical protein
MVTTDVVARAANPTHDVQEVTLPDGSSGWLVTGDDAARKALSDQRLSKVLTAEEIGLTPELTSAGAVLGGRAGWDAFPDSPRTATPGRARS